MIVYTITVNGELKFVETDPNVVQNVAENVVGIDLVQAFADKADEKFVDLTIGIKSWYVAK